MKNKLELQWTNKNKALYYDPASNKYEWVDKKDPRVSEPRILIQKKTYGDQNTENILIKGDNLLALKSLLQDFQNKIKLIYIDPPYNTGNAFSHYDDGMEHSLWLGLMKTRLETLHKLLSNNGSIWISIDNDEGHYLKVICDEIFGRNNFIEEIVWQRAFSPVNLKKTLSRSHDYVLVYAKDISKFKLGTMIRNEKQLTNYKNPDNDSRGQWTSSDCTVGPVVKEKLYPIKTPSGRVVYPPKGRCWLFTKKRFEEMISDKRIWFGIKNNNIPRVKKFLTEVKIGVTPMTLWLRDEVGDNQEAKREVKTFNDKNVFETPKPERLLDRIIGLGSNKKDWVLDSFAGSGTTGAVAHKKNRRWIMVELGEHAETHIIPRLKKVAEGKDKGGITEMANWKGGGGFKYFELGDSLFVRDDDLRLTIINPKMYNGVLIRAVLKVEGFRLKNPNNGLHGIIGTTAAHVTEQYLTQEYIDTLLSEIGEQAKFLVIYAKTISSKLKVPNNVEIRRIPDVLLKKFNV